MASTLNIELRSVFELNEFLKHISEYNNSAGTFFGLGHPMLDISAQVSRDFLQQ